MNTYQVCRQLKYLLQVNTWPDSPNEVVFSSVHVTVGPTEAADSVLRLPLCTIRPLDADTDPQAPGLVRQRYAVTLVAASSGDAIGENALTGGNRTGGQGSSRGRGLLEIEEQFLSVLSSADQTRGVRLREIRRTASEAAVHPGLGYVAYRQYTVESVSSTARSYDPAFRLTATALGSGQVQLAWANPPQRYDWNTSTLVVAGFAIGPNGFLVLRRASGSTPPSSPTAGTGVNAGSFVNGTYTLVNGGPVATVTDTPGAGTWSYSLWAGFDETDSNTAERYSDTAATVTVVAT